MRTIVAQTVPDALGRPVAETKAVYLDGGSALAYRPDAVTSLDPATLALSGEIASACPTDGGYPYRGTGYDTSPAGRVVANGLPGRDFAIVPGAATPHDHEIAYLSNPAVGPLPQDTFPTQADTLPNPAVGPPAGPVTELTVSEPTLGPVAKVHDAEGAHSVALTVYDERGDAVALHPPNFFEPPSGTSDDWRHTYETTALSEVTSWTGPDTGTQRCIYDQAGRLRFTQDPEGAANGWFAYQRYDVLGRTVEIGTLSGPWDAAALQAHANSDPAWPAPDTWQRRFTFDGDGSEPFALGRPTASIARQPEGDPIVEAVTYDAVGGIVGTTLAVPGYDSETRSVAIEANASGDVVRTAFASTGDEADPATVLTNYDALGRVTEVAVEGGAVLARFTYNADGTPATETFDPDGAAPVTRTIDYLSPGWPTAIVDASAQGDLFTQRLTYTSGGYEGAGWFTGLIASATFKYGWPGAPDELAWAYLYDRTGALVSAKSNLGGDLDVGVSTPFEYDPNGNATAGSIGSDALSFDYEAGTNQVKGFGGPGGVKRAYGFDGAGRVSTASGLVAGDDVTFTYDGLTFAPASASWKAGTIDYGYGPRRLRALRVVKDASAKETARKLYVRDIQGGLLAERVDTEGEETVVQHVRGPFGDVALLVHAGGATTTYFPLRDLQGSTRVVLGPGNEVVAAYDYMPSGQLARKSGRMAEFFTFLYTGQELEPELGVYDYRARFYDPLLGRFLAPDPEAELFGNYTYAEDNPVLYTDPSGGFGFLAILGLVGQVLLDVAIEVGSLGTATPAEAPLIAAEVAVDTAEIGVATVEVATTTARVATVATRAGEEAAEVTATAAETATGGEQVVADGAQVGEQTASTTARSSQIVDEPPPGYRLLGEHGTSTISADKITRVGLEEIPRGNFGGYSQYGPGFYTAEESEAANYFADNAVLTQGGKRAIFEVYVPDSEEVTSLEVEEADEMSGYQTAKEYQESPSYKKLSSYDINSGEIRGLEPWRQNKINSQLFSKTKLIRREYSTLIRPRQSVPFQFGSTATRQFPIRSTTQFVVRILRFFR